MTTHSNDGRNILEACDHTLRWWEACGPIINTDILASSSGAILISRINKPTKKKKNTYLTGTKTASYNNWLVKPSVHYRSTYFMVIECRVRGGSAILCIERDWVKLYISFECFFYHRRLELKSTQSADG